MMNYFYDKICSTQRVSYNIVSGGTKAVVTNIYTNIPCAFWKVNTNNLNNGDGALNEDRKGYTLNLQGHNTNVKLGDYLTLKDKTGEDLGKFIVVDVIQYPDITGKIDNIALTIKRYDG